MQTNSWNHLWPGGAEGAEEGPRGAIPRVEKLLLQNSIQKNEIEHREDQFVDVTI